VGVFALVTLGAVAFLRVTQPSPRSRERSLVPERGDT